MPTYYHAALEEDRESIIETGLRPSDAPECECGLGVHVTENIVEARHWVGRLRNERDLYYAEFIIVEVAIDDSYEVVKDEFVGHGPNGRIICTDSPVPPENVGVVEWL